jgi:2-polyprenyl-3-methyl-5-hydroxy-6-metoxy-1,4-benzoquinol methylase
MMQLAASSLPTEDNSIPRCRICNSTKIKKEGVKRGRFVDAEFFFYRCRECGFLFVDPITDFSIYNDAYYAGQGADPLVNYHEEYSNYSSTPRRFEFEELVSIAQRHLGNLGLPQHYFERGISWLDFGCGAGGLLKYLRDRQALACKNIRTAVHPVGHDVGSYNERLKNDEGFEILDWNQLRQDCASRFDVITCIEVIEHVPYPCMVIELLAHCLKPGGILILTTGNLDCPLAKIQGIHFAYCVPEIHVSLFNPALLSQLYRKVKLIPIRLKHDGTIKFRFIKNLARVPGGQSMTGLANFPPLLRLADYLFGVSAIPSAVKALPGTIQR